MHLCRLTSFKYLLLRIWSTLTASWNIVGIKARMMSMTLIFWCSTSSVIITTHHTYFYDFSAGIRRKRRSQNTNRKEHLLMHSCKHLVMPTHIFDHVPFSSCFWTPFSAATARKSYGREVACVKINPKIVVVRTTLSSVLLLNATSLTSGATSSYSRSPNDRNCTQQWDLSTPAVTVVPEQKQFCDDAICITYSLL